MKKAYIKKLVLSCYTEGVLDKKTVEKITDLLNHSELKQFIKVIKSEEAKKTVIVTSAQKLSAPEQKQIEDLYKGKTVTFLTDPTLLTGMRVQNADMIYEQSLKQDLAQIRKEVVQL